MRKIDIMNNRKDETWEIVNGKTQRIEKKKEEIKIVNPIVIKNKQEDKKRLKKVNRKNKITD